MGLIEDLLDPHEWLTKRESMVDQLDQILRDIPHATTVEEAKWMATGMLFVGTGLHRLLLIDEDEPSYEELLHFVAQTLAGIDAALGALGV